MRLQPLVAVLMALFLAACTPVPRVAQQLQAQYLLQYPEPGQAFISDLKPWSRQQSRWLDEICFVINETALWEEGDPEGDVRYDSLEIVLDGERLEPSMKMQVAVLYGIYNKQGNLVGYAGGPTYVCAKKPMKAGVHLVTVKVGARSGKTFSYSWAFSSSADAPAE